MDELELQMLRYHGLQSEYCFELEGDATYVARLETAATAIAPAYGMYTASGKRIGRHVLPSGLPDVELYLLGWFVNWDVKLYR